MNYIKREPIISIQITRPYYSSDCSEKTVVTFVPHHVSDESKNKVKNKWAGTADYEGQSDALLSYSYTESLYDISAPFTITLTPESDNEGNLWIDKIAPMDIVRISEFSKVRYCGIVHDIRYSARMGQDGPARSIIVSGDGFGSLLNLFQLQMDLKYWIGEPSSARNQILKAQQMRDKNTSMKSIMELFYNDFMSLSLKKGNGKLTQAAIYTLLKNTIDLSDLASDVTSMLPVAVGLYQPGVNDIWSMWQKIAPAPYYELFGRWDQSTGKYKVISRQAPFSASDWKKRTCVKIHPLAVTGYDIGYSDSEVKTAYYAIAPSLEITENKAIVVKEFNPENVPYDEDKWSKYGYRPIFATMRYLKCDSEDANTIPDRLLSIAQLMKEWYSKNDELLSGSLSLISIDDGEFMIYPVIGEKIAFLGGEFYVEKIERKFTYGDSPRSNLTITRGYVYDNYGKMVGPIMGLGKASKQFETSSTGDFKMALMR